MKKILFLDYRITILVFKLFHRFIYSCFAPNNISCLMGSKYVHILVMNWQNNLFFGNDMKITEKIPPQKKIIDGILFVMIYYNDYI